jgi:hypothetical protein
MKKGALMQNPQSSITTPPLPVNAPDEAHVFRDLVTAGLVNIIRDGRNGVWWCAPDYADDPGSLGWVCELWTTAWPWFSETQDSGSDRPRRKRITPDMLARRRAALPWINEHMPRLVASGWTRKSLFQAGRHPYPVGQWGLAWSANWTNPDLLSVSIDESGGVAFLLAEASGREVVQAARPRP